MKEVPEVNQIVANDLDETAVEAIARNVAYNQVSSDTLERRHITPNQGDATYVPISFLSLFLAQTAAQRSAVSFASAQQTI